MFPKKITNYFISVNDAATFVGLFFKQVFNPPFHFKEIITQCYEIGLKSLPLISLTGFITGMVFTKQSRPSLETFGATSWLPSLMSIAIVRALGSLVTALICSGKIGSSIGAELGSMRVTEQIDAMEVSAINPYKYLVISRVLATTITIPILGLYCSFIALIGSFVNVSMYESTSFIGFFEYGFASITFLDVFTSVTKSIFFGFTIGMVGCYKGYNANNGTQGVGKAANQAVILSMFLVFIEEIIIVQVSNWIRLY
ncbi:MAG TPA: ABC transporter permease [Bacteroidia bacterium]|nr:ABC transporter permease [Bacteroidia bacterium]